MPAGDPPQAVNFDPIIRLGLVLLQLITLLQRSHIRGSAPCRPAGYFYDDHDMTGDLRVQRPQNV